MPCPPINSLVFLLVFFGSVLSSLQRQDTSQVPLVASIAGEELSVASYETGGVEFERVQHALFEAHQLRITEPSLCDKKTKQYSGYLDVADDKHLFFWFFEARHEPENAPLMLWMSGGPGGSSIASGLLLENGPCRFNASTGGVVDNPYGWNEKLNIIYIDQPVGTGFSYGGGDSTTLANLAADVYAFLQLFLQRFPRYAAAPLHVAGSSWGGHFVPHVGALVHAQNGRLAHAPRRGQLRVNLASLVLANGLTEPASQLETVPDYLCGGAPYPPFAPSDPKCALWRASVPPCTSLIRACYRHPNNATCGAATAYCWPALFSAPLAAVERQGRNVFDLRTACDDDAGELCYAELREGAVWLNRTSTKRALGVDPDFDFRALNPDVRQAFYSKGQAMLDSAALLAPLVDRGVRVLAYAGDTDAVCNYLGVELWMTRLKHRYHTEFAAAPRVPWLTASGYYAGEARTAGDNAVAFVRVFNAGHMAPHDQPEATLDLISKWVEREAF